MAKDPAVLFYTSDFLSGTLTMNYEQKGKYITLLCYQHQQGFLLEEDFKAILDGTDSKVFNKFQKLSDGKYYNLKLKVESERRKAYADSRRNNRTKKDNVDMINLSKSYVNRMETVTVTGTVTDTSINNTSSNTVYSIGDKMKIKPSDKEINELDNLV
jgi:predicted HNH restriction endonuclease